MTEEEIRKSRQQRLDHKVVVTMRLSETTRFVAFGIIAWVFAVQSSDAEFSKSYLSAYEIWVNLAGVLAITSIASDYFQYLCAYISVTHALSRKSEGYQFNKNHPAYLLQLIFFIIKQIAIGIGAITVAFTFTLHVIQH